MAKVVIIIILCIVAIKGIVEMPSTIECMMAEGQVSYDSANGTTILQIPCRIVKINFISPPQPPKDPKTMMVDIIQIIYGIKKPNQTASANNGWWGWSFF